MFGERDRISKNGKTFRNFDSLLQSETLRPNIKYMKGEIQLNKSPNLHRLPKIFCIQYLAKGLAHSKPSDMCEKVSGKGRMGR